MYNIKSETNLFFKLYSLLYIVTGEQTNYATPELMIRSTVELLDLDLLTNLKAKRTPSGTGISKLVSNILFILHSTSAIVVNVSNRHSDSTEKDDNNIIIRTDRSFDHYFYSNVCSTV